MNTIQIKSTLTLNLSADDWQLYNIDGRTYAAERLNLAIAERINDASTRVDVKYSDILSKWSDYGASDSEGHHMVEHILNKFYGDRD